MEEDRGESTRYWCHQCNRQVIPILGVETVKCSSCNDGFVEEMEGLVSDQDLHPDPDPALSLWAPILLGMLSNRRARRRFAHIAFDDDEDDQDRSDLLDRYRRYQFQHPVENPDFDSDRELEATIRRQRRSSATFLHLLHGARSGATSESENNTDTRRERVILINPFNQTIIVQGGGGRNNNSRTHSIGSLGDYISGPELEQLLQHLAENDPSRYGTPPAKKEAIDALPDVTVDEPAVQCSVCLDDFEVGSEAKELPCTHKFHGKCILPWLELHSSCPVCRLELPSDESKLNQERNGSGSSDPDDARNNRWFSTSLPWPLSSLFSSTSEPETGSFMTSTSGSGSGSPPRGHGEEDSH